MFRDDRRAVSVTVGFVLNLSIAAILLSALLVAGGGLIDDQTKRVTGDELSVIGQQVANELSSADRLARAGDTSNLTIRSDLPARTASGGYTITVDGTNDVVVLEASDPNVRVELPFRSETAVANTSVTGGSIEVRFVGGELEVTSG